MHIKKILQIVTLAGLITTGSMHCMLINGLKALIRGTGTAIGIGLPTVPFIATSGIAVYCATKNPISTSEKIRIPSDKEEAFLRETITDKNIAIRINSDSETSGTVLNRVIYIEEKTCASDLTLQEAISTDTPEALEAQKVFRALAQHEYCHAQNNHGLQKSIFTALVPCITTAIAVICVQKLFPFNTNTSVLKHCGRFGVKVIGGTLLTAINLAIGLYAEKIISHHQEYAADQNVAPENRSAMIVQLQNGQKKKEKLLAKTHSTNKAFITSVDQLGHPPVEERIKRLESKKNS